ncbi:hypothetical protein TEPIDINF_002769 [Tepidibacillus infernus]|uniref:hypothetical protein n=1 Tax=Tepidibacillus infernus TaxID=1806172 RepID=UPI003A1B1FDE
MDKIKKILFVFVLVFAFVGINYFGDVNKGDTTQYADEVYWPGLQSITPDTM